VAPSSRSPRILQWHGDSRAGHPGQERLFRTADFAVSRWQLQDRFTKAALFLTTWPSFHRRWPPTPQVHPPTNATCAGSESRVILTERCYSQHPGPDFAGAQQLISKGRTPRPISVGPDVSDDKTLVIVQCPRSGLACVDKAIIPRNATRRAPRARIGRPPRLTPLFFRR
jgi:hypothetical protein